MIAASRTLCAALVGFMLFPTSLFGQQPGSSPVKVFIMAGQSNMVGTGQIEDAAVPGTLEHLVANDPDYAFIGSGSGNWVVRDDVWIIDREGNALDLSPLAGGSTTSIGPELGFGHAVGDLYENQVLIIKAAWGGKSLGVDFLPPSSGSNPATAADGDPGYYYQQVLDIVNDAIANLGNYFPDYDDGGYEIAGFCWHQGWNDRIDTTRSAAYETNMANFINDMRSDLSVPNMPFVIASSALDPWITYTQVEQAQLIMADAGTYPAFSGNVASIDARQPYEGLDFWQLAEDSPQNEGFHWNRNARTYTNLGLAMADAMSLLVPSRCPYRLRASGDASGVTLTWEDGTEAPASVRVLRGGSEIAAAAPVNPASFLDAGAQPGVLEYELDFTMSGTACPPLTLTFDAGITDLEAYRTRNVVRLKWTNNLGYTNIEVRRDGVLIDTLAGTATSYDDSNPPVAGDVTYSLVPTNGSATPTEVTINLDGLSPGSSYVYEPFADADATLYENRVGAGLTGRWIGGTNVAAGSMSFGVLPTSGNQVFNAGGNTTVGAELRSELADAGLLDHGAELWFSFLTNNTAGINTAFMFCLGTDRSTFFGGMEDGGEGIGVNLAQGSAPQAAIWAPARLTGSSTGSIASDTTALVVGRITWGGDAASPDTVDIFLPGVDFVLPASPVSSTSAVLDQSAFKVISFSGKNAGSPKIDEIRLAATYADVIAEDLMAEDTTPPSPDPMSWAAPPTALGDSSITMTATTATDLNDVEYFFESVSGGGNDSGWQDSATYVDTGLAPETGFTYRVRARDKTPGQNTTGWSPDASATTDPVDNGAPPTPGFDVVPTPVSQTSITMTAQSVIDPEGSAVEYYFAETSGNPGGDDSGWQDDTTYLDEGLDPSTTYSYTVRARDKSAQQNESAASAAFDATTLDIPTGPGGALIYEPFDYTPAGSGLSSYTQSAVGLAGNWSDSGTQVEAVGLTYGILGIAGNRVTMSDDTSWVGTGSTLDGFLDDGDMLWFSVLVIPHAVGTNPDFGFALATDQGSDSNNVPLANSGNGLGFRFKGGLKATAWTAGAASSASGVGASGGNTYLVVGEMIFGATDTINLYLPDTDLNRGNVVSTQTATLDQTAFDTITFMNKAASPRDQIDEIRFGLTYEDAVGLGGASSGYDTWVAGPFSGTLTDPDPELDFDGGGLDTGIEWVVGGDPTDPSDDASKTPAFDNTTDPDKFLFRFRRADAAKDDTNTTIVVEYGSSLSGWTAAVHQGTGPTQISISEDDDFHGVGVDRVTVAIPRSLALDEKLFARLKVIVALP